MSASYPAPMKGSQSRQPTAAVIAAVFLFAMAAPARGVDGVSISVGSDASSKVSVDPYRIGVQWSWNKRWLDSGNWYVGGYWDLLAGFWDNTSADRASSAIWELGLTPVFRIRQNRMLAFSPHFEFGVGVHLLSESSVGAQRNLSTAFQFGSLIGIGVSFGPRNALEVTYRYQHLSNADIRRPNSGIEFHILRLGYWLN